MKFSGKVDNHTRDRSLKFGGDLDHCLNSDILKDFFIILIVMPTDGAGIGPCSRSDLLECFFFKF